MARANPADEARRKAVARVVQLVQQAAAARQRQAHQQVAKALGAAARRPASAPTPAVAVTLLGRRQS
jgi:hypothetical protein